MYRIFLATHLAKVIPSAVVRTFLDRCGKVGMIFFVAGAAGCFHMVHESQNPGQMHLGGVKQSIKENAIRILWNCGVSSVFYFYSNRILPKKTQVNIF